MFGSTLGGKAGTSGASNQQGLKRAQIKEPQALIPKMMPHQGSHPPLKPARSTEYQRSFHLTFWCTSDAIARQWNWVTSSTVLCMEQMNHNRYLESQYQRDHASYSTKPSGVFHLQRSSIEGWRLQFGGSHRHSRPATWVIRPLDRVKDTHALHPLHPQGCLHQVEGRQRVCQRDECWEIGHGTLACSQAAYFSVGFRT